MSSNTTTYLITGTTRGIGRGLVSSLLLRPNTTVLAGVRDPSAPTALSLHDLPRAANTTLTLLQIDAASATDPAAALAALSPPPAHLDTVIANAGIYTDFAPVRAQTLAGMRAHFEVNTLSVLALLQATLPLLERAGGGGGGGRFVVTSTALASNALAPGFAVAPALAYGASKAAANFVLSKAAGEVPGVGFLAVHPGLVATDMSAPFIERVGGSGGEGAGPITVEESVRGYLEVLDKPASETNGKFLDYRGEVLPF